MNKYVIVNGLPYLYAEGKTYAVRQDENGLTVGGEVKFDKLPARTYSDLSLKAKFHGNFDSIAAAKEAQPVKAAKKATEPEVEPIVVKEDGVPVDKPEAISDTPDVVDTVAEAEEAAEAIADANEEAKGDAPEVVEDTEEPVEETEPVEEPAEEVPLDGGAIAGIEKAVEAIHEKVDAAKVAIEEAKEAAEEHLVDDMTVAELKAYAEEHGIDLKKARLKAEIVEAIKSAE